MSSDKPKFFAKPATFRRWLRSNNAKKSELWVGFWKKHTNKNSITWPESVDEALCFGWIDGIRKTIDAESYMIRFTPRKSTSHWSNVNIKRIKELMKAGLVEEPGIVAFKSRSAKKSGQAAYEKKRVSLPENYKKEIRKNKRAWKFYSALSPSLTKQYNAWIVQAVKEETRLRRLKVIIESSEKEELIPPLKWTRKK